MAKITNETLEAAWFTEEEAPWSEIAFPQAEGQIRKAYAWLKGGQFGLWLGDTTTEGVEYFLTKRPEPFVELIRATSQWERYLELCEETPLYEEGCTDYQSVKNLKEFIINLRTS